MVSKADGLASARAKMEAAGVDRVAIDTFAHYYGLLESGETGLIREDTIDPVDIERLGDVEVAEADAADALAHTAVIKLNGGLGTSMGMERAKSLLGVGKGLSFLDVIVRQILHEREVSGVELPLLFMNSFRTSADTLGAVARYTDLPVEGLPLELLQNKVPRLLVDGLVPASYPKDPDLEWCPPGHGDIYTALRGSGTLDALLEAGFRYAFVSNSDNLGAVADPRVAGWFAGSGAPFAIEAVRRTPSDKKGGHFARRRSDGRIVLRETAQTADEDKAALADLDRHRFTSTNNIWFDLRAMRTALDERDGILGLPMIRNVKHLDPADSSTPEVVQVETAMGAAIEVFEGATLIEVGRDRFIPVKTTNDLLVLRSDVYELQPDATLQQVAAEIPYVDLDPAHYKLVGDFDRHFPDGVPSLQKASSFQVAGDWTFGKGVQVVGAVDLPDQGAKRVPAGQVLSGPDA